MSVITDTDIDSMEETELDIRLNEIMGNIGLPSGSLWYHANPRFWRDRLRRMLFGPGPGETAYCEEYTANATLALAAASTLGATIPQNVTAPGAIVRLILKYRLALLGEQEA